MGLESENITLEQQIEIAKLIGENEEKIIGTTNNKKQSSIDQHDYSKVSVRQL